VLDAVPGTAYRAAAFQQKEKPVKLRNLTAALIAVCLFAAGCAQPPPPPPPDTRAQNEAEIRKLAADWAAAAAARDLEKSLSYYAADAEMMPPNAPAATTPEARREVWKALIATPGDIKITTTKVEVAMSGDLAFETGTYSFTTADKKKQPVVATGKYTVVWKKVAGKWVVAVDIFNDDAPAK
jgi:uncharacterized protein (TIGR02246 family)